MSDSPETTPAGRALLENNYDLIGVIIKRVAWRNRLNDVDADDFASLVWCRLVEDGYRVLNAFEQRSSLATFLTTVIGRLCLDFKNARLGKWRASISARRQGTTAITFEKLLTRDGYSFDEACAILQTNYGASMSVTELDALRRSFPARLRPRFVPMSRQFEYVATSCEEVETERMLCRQLRLLSTAMKSLDRDDLRLIRMRYRDGWTVARISEAQRLDQKSAYRRFDRIEGHLRSVVAASPR